MGKASKVMLPVVSMLYPSLVLALQARLMAAERQGTSLVATPPEQHLVAAQSVEHEGSQIGERQKATREIRNEITLGGLCSLIGLNLGQLRCDAPLGF